MALYINLKKGNKRATMRTFLVLLLHLVTTVAKLIGDSKAKALIAESLLLKHQMLIVNCTRNRASKSDIL